MPVSHLTKGVSQMEDATSRACVGDFTNQPVSLAMAYVPFQQWQELYDPQLSLERGTMFAQLDKPFIGEEAVPSGK